ncbi:MAG: hypothetical protein JJU36_09000 [Phycisphaeraceae bacterium]|nr:hypothetical protein [Phycisphaeraceae bacterium]
MSNYLDEAHLEIVTLNYLLNQDHTHTHGPYIPPREGFFAIGQSVGGSSGRGSVWIGAKMKRW